MELPHKATMYFLLTCYQCKSLDSGFEERYHVACRLQHGTGSQFGSPRSFWRRPTQLTCPSWWRGEVLRESGSRLFDGPEAVIIWSRPHGLLLLTLDFIHGESPLHIKRRIVVGLNIEIVINHGSVSLHQLGLQFCWSGSTRFWQNDGHEAESCVQYYCKRSKRVGPEVLIHVGINQADDEIAAPVDLATQWHSGGNVPSIEHLSDN